MSADKAPSPVPLRRAFPPRILSAIILLFSQPASAARTASDFCPPHPRRPTGTSSTCRPRMTGPRGRQQRREGDAILLLMESIHWKAITCGSTSPRVTLRSASGNRNARHLDAKLTSRDMVSVAASNSPSPISPSAGLLPPHPRLLHRHQRHS
jgi:hypothetical protein